MKKEPGMAYDTKFLNKVFAVLSIVFLITVVWMLLDDYIRPWKIVQIKAVEVQREVIGERLNKIESDLDKEELAKVQASITAAEEELKADEEKLGTLDDQISDVGKRVTIQKMYNGKIGAKAGEVQFQYEHYKMEGKLRKAAPYKKQLDKLRRDEFEGKEDLKALIIEENKYLAQRKEMVSKRTEAQKALKALVSKRDLIRGVYAKTEKNPLWFIRNSPFIDYLNPSIKIEQIVVEKMHDDRYFQHVPKVDRCVTCHVFIGQKGFEEQENPYKTHPDIETLAVGPNSAHPYKEYGCTSCHGGEGHRIHDFNSPVHMPESEEQKADWIAKYKWHEPHKKPSPMFPTKYTEAGCLKCHGDVEYIPMADKLNKGRKLIDQFGCYGCHKIEGWEHKTKPGPSLVKITAKTNKEFIKNWIWSPFAFNPLSKMPAFFAQSNNSKPEFMKKNIVEVNAMAEYLVAKAKSFKPIATYVGGNAEKGKELIKTVGCISCHQVEGIPESKKVGSRKATYLTGTGSKVDADWLVSWLIKPSHYQHDTIMPSFRLTRTEANNMTAYLMSLKNKKFEQLKFADLDTKIRDELLVDYLSSFDTKEIARNKISKWTEHERTMELGRRSINKYGCYSCHAIDGFEGNNVGIGPELTKVGSKPLEQYTWGHQHGKLDHTRHAWLSEHLRQPSLWDEGVPKSFEALSKMPNYYLKPSEIEPMVLALLAQVSDKVPEKGKRHLSAHEKLAEKGKRIATKYNCAGCHKIDGKGGDITVAYDDGNNAPPWLVKQGHRVQTDWFYNFLRNVHPIRPWLEVRMPSFQYTNDEINDIVTYFQADAGQPTFANVPRTIDWEPGERAAAKKMWDELACVSCHTGGFNKEDPQAPNLHYAKKRLRPSWVEKWLTDPTAILEYTTMPNFWEGGEESAVDDVLDEDPKRQIRAMVKYIYEMGYDSYPTPLYRSELRADMSQAKK